MTPTTNDVAGLVAELRDRQKRMGPTPGEMLNFMSGILPLIDRSVLLLESQAKALREAETDEMHLLSIGLSQLLAAVHADDPKRELLVRIGDLMREAKSITAALDGMMVQGWQGIESAPRDGTAIDLWCGNSEFPYRVTDVQWREPSESEWWVHGGEGMKTADAQWIDPCGWPMSGDEAPTHWMPLPTPPAAQGE
jgi:hypothetical protein